MLKILLGALFSLIFCQPVAFAAAISPQEKEELLNRQRQEAREREAREKLPDVFIDKDKPPVPKTQFEEDPDGFLIHTLTLDGDKVDKFSFLLPFIKQYGEKRIGRKGIDTILKNLTNVLIGRGYISPRGLQLENKIFPKEN